MNFNIPEFSVSEFSRSIKRIVEDAFGYVRIKGEITGFKRASSGHLYFSLKDENSTLSAVCFRNMAQLISFEAGDGLQVVASGRITTFEGRSNYQIIVEKLEVAGIGAMLAMIEKRRQKLLAEGLFDAIHKKALPFFPKIIGVITSQTGAVIEDIKHRIEARCPSHLMLYPSLVQGEKAALEIIQGIRFFNGLKKDKKPDVVIIARGGGSFEDLLPFNDENLIREVFKSEIPIISAVGHETDTTLIDYVSDLRAPTPTAAAELVTTVISDLKNRINSLQEKLEFLPNSFFSNQNQNLKTLQRYLVDPVKIRDQISKNFLLVSKRLDFLTKNFIEKNIVKLPSVKIFERMIFERVSLEEQKIESRSKRLQGALESRLTFEETSLSGLKKLLTNSHYYEIIKRGFALVRNKNGALIFSVSDVKYGDEIELEMRDGVCVVRK